MIPTIWNICIYQYGPIIILLTIQCVYLWTRMPRTNDRTVQIYKCLCEVSNRNGRINIYMLIYLPTKYQFLSIIHNKHHYYFIIIINICLWHLWIEYRVNCLHINSCWTNSQRYTYTCILILILVCRHIYIYMYNSTGDSEVHKMWMTDCVIQ